MTKNKRKSLWPVTAVLFLIIAAIITSFFPVREKPVPGLPEPVSNDSSLFSDEPVRKFFTRHIDTLTHDTMYFVCMLGSNGDTVPDRIAVTYANDSTAYYRYYLDNRGDTVIMDYLHQQVPDSPTTPTEDSTDSLFMAVKDSLLGKGEQELITSIENYLDRVNGANTLHVQDDTAGSDVQDNNH